MGGTGQNAMTKEALIKVLILPGNRQYQAAYSFVFNALPKQGNVFG
jgi:hypothetical protein